MVNLRKCTMKALALLMILSLLSSFFAVAASAGTDGYAAEELRLINAERAKYNLSPLSTTAALNNAARERAIEIAASFSHTRPNGASCFTVLDEHGIGGAARGENIAAGYVSPSDVMEGWMKSIGHRRNILGSYNKIGIGIYEHDGTIYWVQLMIREEGFPVETAPVWAFWPDWAQWFLRYVFFGWIWMRFVKVT